MANRTVGRQYAAGGVIFMKTQRQLLTKPKLLQDLQGLPAKDALQVLAKLTLVHEDPTPDGKFKKVLKHMSGKLYRARFGDYRIIYTYDTHFVSALTVLRRNEDTYKGDFEDDLDADVLGELDMQLDPFAERAP